MHNICGACCSSPKRESRVSLIPSPVASRSSSIVGPKVIIVGGGAAGLACGVKLIEYGFKDITILESQKRIGGRIHTIPFADNNIDLGAQWVHGEKDNIVYEMVKHKDLLETSGDVYVSFQCIRSNGQVVPEKDIQQLKDLLADLFMNQRTQMSEYDGSFADFLETNFFEALKDTKYAELDRNIVREFFENFKKMESSESSLGLDEISARGFLEYWDCEGDYMLGWKEKGYQEFLRVLTKAKYGSENLLGVLNSKVLFDSKVTLIEWDRDDGLIHINCENIDEPFEADNVVVTVSLGVLKKFAENMFSPALPEQKINAIENLGYGHVFKVFIEFPYKFWPPKWTGFTTLWLKEDLKKLEEEDNLWMQEIYGFYLVNNQPRVLQAWAVGTAVPFLERITNAELELHMMNLLKRFLPKWSLPDPVNVIGTSWSTNDNFCGAYSFRTMQTEAAGTSASSLALPLNTMLNVPLESNESDSSQDGHKKVHYVKPSRLTIKPTVLFAGEATSTHYFSTVHGAVESGFREATRLAAYYEYET